MKHVDSKPLSSGHTTSLRRSLRVAEASWQQALASKKHAARSSTAQSSRVAQQYKPAKHSSPPRGRTPDYCTEESLLSPLTPPSAYLPSFLGHAPSSELLPPAVTLSHAEPEHLESSSSLPRATRGRKTEKQERNTRPAGVAQTRNNITSRQGGTINATSTVNFQVGASTSGAHPTHTAAHLELPLPTRASVALPDHPRQSPALFPAANADRAGPDTKLVVTATERTLIERLRNAKQVEITSILVMLLESQRNESTLREQKDDLEKKNSVLEAENGRLQGVVDKQDRKLGKRRAD